MVLRSQTLSRNLGFVSPSSFRKPSHACTLKMLSKKAVSLGNTNNKRKQTAFSASTEGSRQQDDVTSSRVKKTSTQQPPQPRELSQESTLTQRFPLFASAGGSRQQDDGTSSHAKKTRGITVGAGTCDVVKKSKKLIPIRLDPSQNLVASVEAQYLFVSEIGLITRNKAPLNVLGWKKVTLETKRDMAIALQFKFEVDLTDPAMWKFIDDHMNSTYNDWRAKLHKHYKEYASDPEVARATPPLERSLVLKGL
ncbi:uncharacterized protein LOC110747199 [Prunus avium]|uniref:Uncharacterized protein LOC110747199 n=1 Tax=Prunus avium TaxID=42229 RepID=A0A6P5RPV9_PRUAV|nr:uncharacterized protein LOC110747199 [Prunus avium]XP_021803076.1 uncharacterized protein LOC110747199 [Prunus avium]XP_021803077.1 uncharacterized protein LOC110747199 [Prunus avium]XP_021803078.1 uncharacterized protein LOC110747199 [Prunus avium]